MSEKDELYLEAITTQSEAVLNYIGKRLLAQEAKEIDLMEEESKNITISTELRDRIFAAIKKEKQKQAWAKRKRFALRVSKACAIVLLMLVTTSVVLVNTVDAVKYKFENLLTDFKNDHIKLSANESSASLDLIIPDQWIGVWYPGYLPEGFKIDTAHEEAGIKTLIFMDETDRRIAFTQYSAESRTIHLDNEGDAGGQIEIKYQYTGYWTMDDQETTLLWLQDDKIMQIVSTLELNEVEKIAENLKYKK